MSKYKIEKGINIKGGRTPRTQEITEAVKDMEVGDSILFEERESLSAVRIMKRDFKWKVATRAERWKDGQHRRERGAWNCTHRRVWRTE